MTNPRTTISYDVALSFIRLLRFSQCFDANPTDHQISILGKGGYKDDEESLYPPRFRPCLILNVNFDVGSAEFTP